MNLRKKYCPGDCNISPVGNGAMIGQINEKVKGLLKKTSKKRKKITKKRSSLRKKKLYKAKKRKITKDIFT